MTSTKSKTTTIQISLKTKEYLDRLKDEEQLSNYDAVIRIIILNYKLFKEINSNEKENRDLKIINK